jgi:COMM domain containing 4|tara:strand:+ start:130 stop:600 length:471 start_codon:yes stop_codon:yes gene_type:complete
VDKELDYGRLQKLSTKLTLSRSDVKAALAAINFLLDSATRYDVDRSILDIEMQQLGLTRETSATLLDVYFSKKPEIEQNYRTKEFKMEPPGSIRWRLDYIIGSSVSKEAHSPSVRLKIPGSKKKGSPLQFDVPVDKFRVLLSELKTAQAIIQNLEK